MTETILIVDALSAGSGKRTSSRDSIGCGPRAVAGVLETENIPCRIERVEAILTSPNRVRKYAHLAISAMSMDFAVTKQLILLWRKSKPGAKVILGGPIASNPREILSHLKPDVLVIGEGEETLHELISMDFFEDRLSLSEVDGIGYIQEKEHVTTHLREFLNPETLWQRFPPSATRIVDYPVYQASKVYVETVRGCSNFRRTTLQLPDGRVCSDCGNCESDDSEERMSCPEEIPAGCGFCSVPSVWGAPRSRPIPSIVHEISELIELGVHRIVLEAPDFLDYMRGSFPMTDPCSPETNLSSIENLLSEITKLQEIAEGRVHLSIENMKACLFSEEVASSLSSVLKSTSPNIGLETGSEAHSKAIGKCGSPLDVIRAVEVARKYGMNPFVYFIYGLPGEDEDSIKESVKLMNMAASAGAERIILYGFRPLPASAFADFSAPDSRDPLSEILRTEAARINREKKVDYMGQVIRGIAAEPSWEKHGFTMVYPLAEGPLMTIEGGFSPGTILNIEITSILSPGLLGGKVIQDSTD